MDKNDYITNPSERKKGKHLTAEDRGAIQALRKEGYGVRAIARNIGCAPGTITYELRRGTPERKGARGRSPGYSAKHGEKVYKSNRSRCHRRRKAEQCKPFIRWVERQFREHKWSPDSSYGYAKRMNLFPKDEMVSTGTLYNMIWAGLFPISVTELPVALKRKSKKTKPRENKRCYGTSISERPKIVSQRIEEGHWEGDTVVGKRNGQEAVIFSLLEKKTENYIAIRISGKTSEGVMEAMQMLREEYGDRFSQVFKTITVDNGSEFADFSQVEAWGTKVYFAHPYSSWERSQNERHNGLFRDYVPKGESIEQYSEEYLLMSADELNGRPRKKLGYCTPEELFEAFLDAVFAA